MQELKAQLENMGLPTEGLKKAELAEKLAEGLRKFSLSDDNFQHAEVVDTTSQDSGLPNCFPQVIGMSVFCPRNTCVYLGCFALEILILGTC